MPERYVHLVDDDVDEAYLRLHGIIKEDKLTDIKEDLPVNCELCGAVNMPDAKLCTACNRALDIQTAIEMEAKEMQGKEKQVEDLKSELKAYLKQEIEEMKKIFKENQ